MSPNQLVDRRKAIKQASLLLGFTITGPALTGVLNGCTPSKVLDWRPSFFTEEEAFLIEAASARILPSGETPGAAEVNAVRFIDQMVAEYYLPEDQVRFRTGMQALEAHSEETAGKSFIKASESEQDTILSEQALTARKQFLDIPDSPQPFFLMLKELTILGFFTSEIGATQFLNFDETPGGYQGCVPMEDLGGKAWAT
ncbi:MAG: hypothetical protein DHS20C17_30140 [Cyclobacteriaceae bacterium]|nr:MAG: hypothetical protein DHS20C17_30140 [Cyclobacteriaceae bacterium]